MVTVCRIMSSAVRAAVSVSHRTLLLAAERMGNSSFSGPYFFRTGAGGICQALWSVCSRWWARSPQGFSMYSR